MPIPRFWNSSAAKKTLQKTEKYQTAQMWKFDYLILYVFAEIS